MGAAGRLCACAAGHLKFASARNCTLPLSSFRQPAKVGSRCASPLPTEFGSVCYSAGCTLAEVRGCVRHLIVCGPYHTPSAHATIASHGVDSRVDESACLPAASQATGHALPRPCTFTSTRHAWPLVVILEHEHSRTCSGPHHPCAAAHEGHAWQGWRPARQRL